MVTSANEQTCLIASEHLHLHLQSGSQVRQALESAFPTTSNFTRLDTRREAEAQIRSSLTSATERPRRPDTCCSVVRAERTAHSIPNSIIEHYINPPTPSGSQPISLAMRNPHLTLQAKKSRNTRSKKRENVCEQRDNVKFAWNVRLTWRAANLTRVKARFSKRATGGTSLSLSKCGECFAHVCKLALARWESNKLGRTFAR
jgi:hypothetical protein